MQASKLRKDKTTNVRFSSEVMEKLKELGFKSIQQFLDAMIDKKVKVKITK